METLIMIVRVYRWWIFAWVVMTWIPGLAGSPFHALLGIPVVPVVAPFDFLSVGMIGFGPIVPLLLLYFLEEWMVRQVQPPPERIKESDEDQEPVEVLDVEGGTIDTRRDW